MPYFLSGFLNQHPGVELVLDVTNKARVVESIEKNEVKELREAELSVSGG